MASHALSGLTGTKEGHDQLKAGDTPTKDGFMPRTDGPNEHIQLLEYYFGSPTSTVKDHQSPPHQSQW